MFDSILDMLDPDVIYSFAYWILVIIFEAAVIIGFGGGGFLAGLGLGQDAAQRIPFLYKMLTILLLPVAAYLVVKKIQG